MNHKKLEQIKKNWEFRKDVRGHIEGIDVDWLIEQTEKVTLLESSLKTYKDESDKKEVEWERENI